MWGAHFGHAPDSAALGGTLHRLSGREVRTQRNVSANGAETHELQTMGRRSRRRRRYAAESSEPAGFGRQSPKTVLHSVRDQIASGAHSGEADARNLSGSNDIRGCQGPRALLSARTGRRRGVEDRGATGEPGDDGGHYLQSPETEPPRKRAPCGVFSGGSSF